MLATKKKYHHKETKTAKALPKVYAICLTTVGEEIALACRQGTLREICVYIHKNYEVELVLDVITQEAMLERQRTLARTSSGNRALYLS